MLDVISAMNNEVKLAAPAHNLLLRKVAKGDDHQLYMNMISSVQVSPQTTRKKRFMSLNLEHSWASNAATLGNISIFQKRKMD
jgi:hypothetical protein